MKHLPRFFKLPLWALPALLTAFVAGCGGSNLDPILGSPGATATPTGAGLAPTITATSPVAATPVVTGVATNSRVRATFSKPMAPATLTPASFTLACPGGTPVAAAVSYDAATQIATLTPTLPLPTNTLCVATVTTAAQDTFGLPLASNFIWSFMTGATADTTPPTVTSVSPLDGTINICLSETLRATFSEPMDATTINTSTFTVTDNGTPVAGTVSYDAVTRVASFTPASPTGFVAGKQYVVTLKGGSTGVKDDAGNALVTAKVWAVTAGTQTCSASTVNLGTAAAYGAFGGGAGVTNQGIYTVVNGNLGTTAACTLITGFHDAANVYTETPLNIGLVNGSIYCGPPAPGTVATLALTTQALNDALAAWNTLAAMPGGTDPGAGQLGGLVLAPGVYKAAGGTFDITTGGLTLDAQGNANAVWVFQTAAALTLGLPATPRTVLLVNGAQAKNVFWQVGSAARIENGSTMVGTIIAPAGVTISTSGQTALTTLTGRAIGLTASVTMVNTLVVAP